LDFSGAQQSYQQMIKLVYGENYKNYEKQLLTDILNKGKNIQNEQIQPLIKNTKEILEKYTDEYISLEKGKYLKYYIDKELEKYPLSAKGKQTLSRKAVKDYIHWYCSNHHDFYCKTKLEKLPVGFKINLTKIREFIEENLSK
jgi:hypothetical protein